MYLVFPEPEVPKTTEPEQAVTGLNCDANFQYKLLYVISRTAEVTTLHIFLLAREANG